MTRDQASLIVLAKAPVAGRVKTRCSPPCSSEQAARLARAALSDTLDAVRSVRGVKRRVLALDGEPPGWLPAGFDIIGQRGLGLGERIDNAFVDVGAPAVLIGMDTPQVNRDVLEDALDRVSSATAPVVVGPSDDGGFWAIGAARSLGGLCAHVPMSQPDTYERLKAELRVRRLSWTELAWMVDVDDFATGVCVARAVPHSRFARIVTEIAATLSPETLGC
ncbi:MAG: DUF2064 domain-containing protein [Acidimicrobiales bacterium]